MLKLNSKQLRKTKPVSGEDEEIKRNPICIVLDNIIDTYNIGSIFRLADAVAIEKVYICGDSDYPPSSRIHKAAVGTEEWVPWEKKDSTPDMIKGLKKLGIQIIAVEQDKKAVDYRQLTKEKIKFPVAIVVGHETTGISKEVLDLADLIIELPMFGVNKSFNVWGSAAVVIYKIIESLQI